MGQLGRDIGFGYKGISGKTEERPHPFQSQKQSRAGFISALNHFVVAAEEPPDPAGSVGWEGRSCSPTRS